MKSSLLRPRSHRREAASSKSRPVEAKALVQVPRRTGGGRSPFDIFGMDDPFSDPFFNDPFGGMTEQRQMEMKSQPDNARGQATAAKSSARLRAARSEFSTSATRVKPTTAQVGDPFTVTATISGRGNFDRVTAPDAGERPWLAHLSADGEIQRERRHRAQRDEDL